MNKPTKKQLLDRLAHFEEGLKCLAESELDSGARVAACDLLFSAPSLEPVVKTYKEQVVEELGESALTGVTFDPEAPATE